MPLVCPGVGVEDDDTPVSVPIGDKHFVGLRIDDDHRRSAHVLRVVAVDSHAGMADLQQEFPILGELQDLAVSVAVAGQPDVVLVVDRDAVLATAGPSVAVGPLFVRAGGALYIGGMESPAVCPLVFPGLGRTAPALNVVASFIELEHWRRWLVPVVERVPILECVRALEYPDIPMRIRVDSADPAHHQTLRHLREAGVHLEQRHDRLRALFLTLRDRRPLR